MKPDENIEIIKQAFSILENNIGFQKSTVYLKCSFFDGVSKEDYIKILGITSGFCTGKIRFQGYLEETYWADISHNYDVARKLQQRGTRCFRRIVDMFGPGILGADGEIDRAALGTLVFSDEERLHELNGIVHPLVIRAVRQRIR